MAEFALKAATSRLNQCGGKEERLARLGPFGLQTCRKEVIRLEYGRDMDAVNKLEATVSAFPQLTASAKARALRASTLCAQRYSNVPLPSLRMVTTILKCEVISGFDYCQHGSDQQATGSDRSHSSAKRRVDPIRARRA